MFTAVIGLVTLVLVFLTYHKMASRPHVIVRFWENNKLSEKITLSLGDQALDFLFRNIGDQALDYFLLRNIGCWLNFRKPAATMLTAFIYFPKSFTIIEASRYETLTVKTKEVFSASPSGKFKGMQYIAVPSVYEVHPPAISILSYEEDVLCKVKINIPDTGKVTEDIYIQMTSGQGDLGVHKLVIKVKQESQ